MALGGGDFNVGKSFFNDSPVSCCSVVAACGMCGSLWHMRRKSMIISELHEDRTRAEHVVHKTHRNKNDEDEQIGPNSHSCCRGVGILGRILRWRRLVRHCTSLLSTYDRNPNESSSRRGRHGMNCPKFTKSPENIMVHGSPK